MVPIVTRWLLALCLIGVAGRTVSAEPLAPLFKTLDLRGYPTRTAAPAFSGSTLEGRPLSIAEHRGKVIVLNFWASWCVECRAEMPALERLQREFAARGFAVVGVNARETKEVAARYVRELGLTFPVVLDADGKINVLYGVIGLPATFVVGRDGRAIAFAIGPRDWHGAAGRALMQALLDEPAPGPGVR